MSPQKKIEELLEHELFQGFFTHAYVACGHLDAIEPEWEVVRQQSNADIFDLASLTKALVTGPLVMKRMETQGLTTGATLQAFAPQFTEIDSRYQVLTLDELLGHHAGLPAWWNFWMGRLGVSSRPADRREIIHHACQVFARMGLRETKADLYSDLGYILLGLALESSEGQTLGVLWSALQAELGGDCKGLHYPPLASKPLASYIPSAYCPVRERLLIGEVHDENCAALGGITGHAGIFGRGRDLVSWLHCLYVSPLGRRYLEANEAKRKATPHEGLLGLRRGNGLSSMPFAGGESMGHPGFTGTAFWIHLPSRRYAIFLSNRVISGRVNPHITEVRRQLFTWLDACLGPL
jgi:CubicO group peptidase (beta-lactamase class C family)